jgi:hypothetical protein
VLIVPDSERIAVQDGWPPVVPPEVVNKREQSDIESGRCVGDGVPSWAGADFWS